MVTESRNSSNETTGPRLLDRLRDAIRRRHYSRRTEEAYIHWTKRFIYFHGKRHPWAAVTAFLNHLATDRNVAASTQNQALSAKMHGSCVYVSITKVILRRICSFIETY